MLHIFISASGERIRPGATGRPVPGYQAMVVDDEMRPLPPARSAGSPCAARPAAAISTTSARRNYVRDGWNLTGDAYTVDDDGYFWFQARTDDMIISAGYNIAGAGGRGGAARARRGGRMRRGRRARSGARPDREGVRRAAPGDRRLDALRKELQDFVKQRIAPYKYPRAIEFLDALPRTETGKVQRFRLRQIEAERAAAPAA